MDKKKLNALVSGIITNRSSNMDDMIHELVKSEVTRRSSILNESINKEIKRVDHE